MIKSAEKAIAATMGNADVTDEELDTVFAEAEALINSRPLTYQSAEPRDNVPLTPNVFYLARPADALHPMLSIKRCLTLKNVGGVFKKG